MMTISVWARSILVTAAVTATIGWAQSLGDIRLRTQLTGGAISGLTPSGQAEFKARPSRGPELSFHVEVEDVNLPPGTSLEVQINGRPAGRLTISIPPVRGGELELNSRDGDVTPELKAGDVITVRSSAGVVLSGAIQTRALDDILRNPPAQSNSSAAAAASASSAGSAGDTSRFRTGLAGGAIGGVVPSGHIDFRQRGSDYQLTVEVEDLNLPLGAKVDVEIDGRVIGQITVAGVGRGGELELNTRDGALVQQVRAGAVVLIRAPGRGAVLTGVAQPVSQTPVPSAPASSPANSSQPQQQGDAARLRSGLTGGAVNGVRPSGHIDFRTQPGQSDARLNVEVEDINLPAGTVLDVEVDGRVVGQITLSALRGGELELNTRDGAVVDRIKAGATVVVRAVGRGAILSGVAQARPIDTPASSSSGSSSSSSSSSSNTGGSSSSSNNNSGDDKKGGSGNSGSGSSNSGSGSSGNSGSGSSNSGSGNSGSGSSGSGNSGSGSSNSGSGGSSGSGSGNSGSGNSGSGSSSGGGGKDDKK